MLESLYIRNYRNLKEFEITSLGKVNLITGKNNTGKSTILEAIAIYAAKGNIQLIYQLLEERGENLKGINSPKDAVDAQTRALSSMFNGRRFSFKKEDAILLGSRESLLSVGEKLTDDLVSLRLVKYQDENDTDKQGNSIRRRILLESDDDKTGVNFKVGLEIKVGEYASILSLEERPASRIFLATLTRALRFEFIRTRGVDRDSNGTLWDQITLTEKEQYVIEALQIIEPTTERIAFIEERSRQRTAVIKLSNVSAVLPLQSMGDGINRVLTIILALVNADNGFLLIDEFENGLHHSVQEQLWKIIFNLADKLNVQVFATTHSEDCIAGFENILNSPENKLEGKLIRLDNVNGVTKQVEFSADELKIATDQNIEIR